MKKAFLVLLTAAMLVLAGSGTYAFGDLRTYELAISDITDSTPIVTTVGLPGEWSIDSSGDEYVTGHLTVSGTFAPEKTLTVALTEPGDPLTPSDFLTISTSTNGDTLYYAFYSDGAAAFSTLNIAGAILIPETGDWQDLSLDFVPVTLNLLDVSVRSDLEGIPDVPLPPTACLLGSGLIPLVWWRRRNRLGK